jgi:hypothetical protein
MIVSENDYYHKARSIAADLKRIGRARDGQEIFDAMDMGSTATEILMALRYTLLNVISDGSLPGDIKDPATTLIAELSSILR